MKTYEVLLPIKKNDVNRVVLALFRAGFNVYEPSYNEEVSVAFTATDEQVTDTHENKSEEVF